MKPARKPHLGEIEHQLRAERPAFPAPADFTETVMARLGEREKVKPSRSRTPVFRYALGLAGAACVLAIALKLVPGPRHSEVDTEQLAQMLSRIRIPELSAQQVDALSAKLDDPLETELKNVISDTRQAIQFVASNFLPEN